MVARALSSSQAPAPWDRSRDYDDETDDDERVNPWDLDVDEAPMAPPFNDARVPSWVTLTRARWDKVTTSMASCATVPFLFLTMPQIVKNTGLIAAGRPDALAAISWQGQLAGLLGNMLLLSYFADKGELSASFVQIVGTCATGALLTQMCLAGHIPIAPFAVAAAAVSAGLILSGFRMLGRIGPVDTDGVPCVGNVQCAVSFDEDDEEELSIHGWWMRASNGLWDFYTLATGIVGLAALPQIGLMSLMPATLAAQCGVYPGAAGAALGTLLIILPVIILQDGTLLFLCGGDQAAFDAAIPGLDVMGSRRWLLGPTAGDAARAKLMLQVMMGNIVGSLAEMMALSKAAGLDEAAILEVLGESAMANPLCKAKGELMRKNDYKPNFQVYLQQKDLRLALQLADDLGVPAPISAASNGQYIRARQMGFADKDFAAVRAAYEAEVMSEPETEDA